jgi:hypothetical protein
MHGTAMGLIKLLIESIALMLMIMRNNMGFLNIVILCWRLKAFQICQDYLVFCILCMLAGLIMAPLWWAGHGERIYNIKWTQLQRGKKQKSKLYRTDLIE